MANAKISQLPAASTPLAGTEVLPIVQSGVTDQVSVANLTFGRSVSTGNLSVVGTLDVSGNVAINTNKFTVTASSGNTAVAGTLDSAGNFSVATNKFNVTASSGDTSFIGDLAINTNKFNVTASSGNTAAAGTLSATGDFAINTNKFNVTASSGNTTVAGTLGVTGMTTLTGGLIGGVQALSGAGAVDLVTVTTAYTSTATGNALTLANGTAGQIKTVVYVAEAAGGDTGILTPTSALGFTSITFNTPGQTATLQYFSQGWVIISVRGASVV